MGPGRGISALSLSQTLCRLRVNHSSCLIRGTGDWIAETIDLETGKVVAQSDPFSKWYGSGYAGANVTLVVAQDAKNSGYLDMTPKDFGRVRNGGGISEPKPTHLRGAEIASFS